MHDQLIGFTRWLELHFHSKALFVRRFSRALGDNLLITVVLPHLRKINPERTIVVESNWPELFYHNPHVDLIAPLFVDWFTTRRHLEPKYVIVKDTKTHLTEQLLAPFGISQKGTPELYLTERELESATLERDTPYIAICPTAKSTWASNRKQWGTGKFKALAKRFSDASYKMVQVGGPNDTRLPEAEDARGLPIRKSAAIIAQASMYIGLEGALMHVARAVGTPATIIYGGFIHPRCSGYEEHLHIHNPIACSPCAHTNASHEECPTMACMDGISPKSVFEQALGMLATNICKKL